MRVRRRVRLIGLVAAVALHSLVHAQPHVPARDDVVLAQVAAGSQQRRIQALRNQLARDPSNLGSALELSRAWLDAGRREGDPRFFSYVQATLAPWTHRPDAPAEALIFMAIAQQSLHRFDEALVYLDRALRADPRNAQAWLTRATILQVRGNFDEARRSCARLPGIADSLIAATCAAALQGMNGGLDQSYAALLRLSGQEATMGSPLRGWMLGQLGDMAVRRNDLAAAEKHFLAALAANPEDSYVRGELADLYLQQRREREVMTLLRGMEAQDALLLRLAIAEARMGNGRRWSATYEARYRAALQDGDTLHEREHARYLLEVRKDTQAALLAARDNWTRQREPADIRIYWNASAASMAARENIRQWIVQHGYQDASLDLGAQP